MIYALIILLKLGGTDYKITISEKYNLLEIMGEVQPHPFKFILIDKREWKWYYITKDFSCRTEYEIANVPSFFAGWQVNSRIPISTKVISDTITFRNGSGVKVERLESMKISQVDELSEDTGEEIYKKHISLGNIPIFAEYISTEDERKMSFLVFDKDLDTQFPEYWIFKSEFVMDDYHYTDYEIINFYEKEVSVDFFTKFEGIRVIDNGSFLRIIETLLP